MAFGVFVYLAQTMRRRSAEKSEREAARAENKAAQIEHDAKVRASKLQNRIEAMRARREQIRIIREARYNRAEIQARSEQSGVGTSTSAQGALASVRSQFGSQLSQARFISSTLAKISQYNIEASERAQVHLNRAASIQERYLKRQAQRRFIFAAFETYQAYGGSGRNQPSGGGSAAG